MSASKGSPKKRLAAVFMIAFAHTAAAQQADDHKSTATQHSAHAKLTIGISLLGVGAFVLPATHGDTGWSAGERRTGMALIAAGSGFVVWGLRDRYKATAPSTCFGISIGRTNALQISRDW